MGAPEAFTATTTIGHFIAGQVMSGNSPRRQDVFNPATGRVARQLVLGSEDACAWLWLPRRLLHRAGPRHRRFGAHAC
jgi:hypothetical protein